MSLLIDIMAVLLLLAGAASVVIDIKQPKMLILMGIIGMVMLISTAGIIIAGHGMNHTLSEAQTQLQKEQEWKKSQLGHLEALFAQYLPDDKFHVKDFDFFAKLGWTSKNRIFDASLAADKMLLEMRQTLSESIAEERETVVKQISEEIDLSVIQAQFESLGIKVAIQNQATAPHTNEMDDSGLKQELLDGQAHKTDQETAVIEITEVKNDPPADHSHKTADSEHKTPANEHKDEHAITKDDKSDKNKIKPKEKDKNKKEKEEEPELLPITPAVANVLYFGKLVNQADLKLAAIIFMRAGIQLKAIKSFNKKKSTGMDHVLALGFNKQFEAVSQLTLEVVTKKSFK